MAMCAHSLQFSKDISQVTDCRDHSLERGAGRPAAKPPPGLLPSPMKWVTMKRLWILPVAVFGSLSVMNMRVGTCAAGAAPHP